MLILIANVVASACKEIQSAGNEYWGKIMLSEINKNRFGESPGEILIRCLDKGDFTEWNDWRKNECNDWRFYNYKRQITFNLDELRNVELAGSDLSKINLKMIDLQNVNLAGVDLSEASLAGANLSYANLIGADLWKADLESANLTETNLKSAQLKKANLKNARMIRINLEGADLWKANLKGAKFISVVVNSKTFIWGCNFDEQTVFRGRGLSRARIEPRLIEHLRKKKRIC